MCLERGFALIQAGRASDAIAPLRRAAALDPGNADPHHGLGLVYLLCERLPEAVASLRSALILQPGHAGAHFNLALALERLGHDDAAMIEYRTAVNLNPKYAEAHANLGDLLLGKGQRDEAVAHFRRSATASLDSALGRVNQAKALVFDGQTDAAMVWIRRARARDARDAKAQSQLGDLLAELGRFDEAAACFERAITLDPQQIMAYNGLVRSKRITDADRPLIARAEAQIASGMAERRTIPLHFALGKAFDDLKDFAAAMRHFDAANRALHRASPFNSAAFARTIDRLKARFTKDFFRQHGGLGAADETPIFILGMPRSGTTLVEQIISNHPAVTAGGELAFWIDHLRGWEERSTETIETANTIALGEFLPCAATPNRTTRNPRDRQDALQLPRGRPDPTAVPECPHHPLPPAPDRYMPVDLLNIPRQPVPVGQ